jgi:hypothetical protein
MKKHGTWVLFLALMTIVTLGVISLSHGQEKTKKEGTSKYITGFTIARLVVGTGVENNEPVGVAEAFPDSTVKVYCLLEASNVMKDTEVSFVWFHGGKEMGKISLPLKMRPRWRTYVFKNLRRFKEDWKVEIKDAEGNILKEVNFKVKKS